MVQCLRMQVSQGTYRFIQMTLIYSGPNKHMFGGVAVETVLFIFLLYVPGVNGVFGGRPLPFFLLGIPGLGFSILLLIWEETRKFLMNWDYNKDNRPNWFQRSLLWWFIIQSCHINIINAILWVRNNSIEKYDSIIIWWISWWQRAKRCLLFVKVSKYSM